MSDLIRKMNALSVAPGCLAIWGLGQMGFAIQGSGNKVLYIDPVLSDVVAIKFPETAASMSRAFPAPVASAEITNAAWVLCTHEHIDHTDPLTLGPLAAASPQAQFITSAWSGDLLDEAGIPAARRSVPPIEKPIDLGGPCITALPAAHYDVEIDPNKGSRYLSFVIEWNGVRLFHSGDTLLVPEVVSALRRQAPIDVGILAANGRDPFREANDILGNATPEEAVWLATELNWDVLIGGHNDLFPGNVIPAGALADAVRRWNPRQKFHTLQPGELYYYVKA